MAAPWNPAPLIAREARLFARRLADAVAAARPRVPHRDGTARKSYAGLPTGGSLAASLRAVAIVEEKPWGAVVRLASLGQKFLWFVQGTQRGGKTSRTRGGGRRRVGGVSRQVARPIDLGFPRERLVAALEADAARHYQREEGRAA